MTENERWWQGMGGEARTCAGCLVLLAAALLLIILLGMLWPRLVHADDGDRFDPATRSPRYAVTRALVEDRAFAHDVLPWVLWGVVRCEAGPTLDPFAVGDHGHSFGLAQLNDRSATGNLLGHFYSLGYVSAFDAWSAVDYLSRALSGEFADSPWARIGPWRWTCWRRLRDA